MRELQCLAAFQSQVYIFTRVEKIRIYDDSAVGIKRVCKQIVDGDQVFALLYEMVNGDDGGECWLKTICSGASLAMYIAAVDFTVETILKYCNGKAYAGKQFGTWDWRCTSLC